MIMMKPTQMIKIIELYPTIALNKELFTFKKQPSKKSLTTNHHQHMYRPVHSWIKVPVKQPVPHLHKTLCLEYPPKLLSGEFHPSAAPTCPSRDAARTGPQSLIVTVPGNPGLAVFYDKFMTELCQTIPNLGVVVPSLGGFSLPTSEVHHKEHHNGGHHSPRARNTKTEEEEHERMIREEEAVSKTNPVFLLKDQYEFMYSFVDNFIIPIIEKYDIPMKRVFITGHSIGSEINLHVLDHFRNTQLKNASNKHQLGVFHRAVLLAPTIAYMEESNNAKKLYNIIHHGKFFLPTLISGILTKLLPSKVINVLLDMMLAKELDAADVQVAQEIVHHPRITRQCLKLGSDELYTVNPINLDLLKRIQEHLIFYYVKEDDWVPAKLHKELREKFGGNGQDFAGFFVGEDENVKHAWCSRAYLPVAHFVAHCFGATTGVQVTIASAEAEKAGFKLVNDETVKNKKKESGTRRTRSQSK